MEIKLTSPKIAPAVPVFSTKIEAKCFVLLLQLLEVASHFLRHNLISQIFSRMIVCWGSFNAKKWRHFEEFFGALFFTFFGCGFGFGCYSVVIYFGACVVQDATIKVTNPDCATPSLLLMPESNSLIISKGRASRVSKPTL